MNNVMSSENLLGQHILDGVSELFETLTFLPEEEALDLLRSCKAATLEWILNELAIPAEDFYIASLAHQVLKEQTNNKE